MLTIAVVSVAGLSFMLVEWLVPGRALPRVRGFHARAFAASAVQATIAYVAGSCWDAWMIAYRPWSAGALPTLAGGLLGYLVITFVYYFWHRARHESPWLWRWFHQLHHSPSRIETLTAFYKHPLEMVVNGLLSSAILYLLVGLAREAATLAVMFTGLAELFYHCNMRTPRWVGLFLQRPEMHGVHHQRGHHSCNFSDLPLWDVLFGTYHNPQTFAGECGFEIAEERSIGRMLRGLDVRGKP